MRACMYIYIYICTGGLPLARFPETFSSAVNSEDRWPLQRYREIPIKKWTNVKRTWGGREKDGGRWKRWRRERERRKVTQRNGNVDMRLARAPAVGQGKTTAVSVLRQHQCCTCLLACLPACLLVWLLARLPACPLPCSLATSLACLLYNHLPTSKQTLRLLLGSLISPVSSPFFSFLFSLKRGWGGREMIVSGRLLFLSNGPWMLVGFLGSKDWSGFLESWTRLGEERRWFGNV